MITALLSRTHAWITEAPWLALVMLVSAIIVFWWVLQKNEVAGWVDRRAKWLGIVTQAIVLPLLLLAVLWGMRVTLARTEYDFRRQHGSVSQVNLESVEKIWGRPHVQRDLVVSHSYLEPVTEEVRDAFDRVVTRTRMERRYIPQNSVTRTRGNVTLTRSERKKGTAKYPGFLIDCDFNYTVQNFADRKTDAEFIFPLSPEQSKFDHFIVRVDGEDQSARLNLDPYNAIWTLPMEPGQVATVDISYKSQGLQRFYYQVADVREIRDFQLDLHLPDIPERQVNYPEGCIPPPHITRINEGRGCDLTWKLDRALTTRGMGIALPDPSQPGQQVARILRYVWRGGMLLLVTLAITAIALGYGFHPLRIALVAAIFTGQFMLLAAISDFFPNAIIPWALVSLGAVALAVFVYGGRSAPKPVLALLVIFMGLYPLLTLPEDLNRSLMTGMDVLVIIYLALLGAMALRRQTPATQRDNSA